MKGQRVTILDRKASVPSTQFCFYSEKTALDSVPGNGRGCVFLKLYLQKEESPSLALQAVVYCPCNIEISADSRTGPSLLL